MAKKNVLVLMMAAAILGSAKGSSFRSGNGDVGHWNVGDCILAQFAMEIQVKPFNEDKNKTETYDVPPSAQADQDLKDCGNDTQTLTLYWSDKASNDSSVTLMRNLTLIFVKNETASFYGMSRFFANIEYAKWNEEDEENVTTLHTSTIVIDSHLFDNPMFHTPLDRSFLCNDVGQMSFFTSIKYDYKNSPPAGTELANATVEATKLQMDAFRVRDHVPSDFRIPMDCDYHPDDAVPIAVGVALAVMVVAVLVAYMYGRRRNTQRGYESV